MRFVAALLLFQVPPGQTPPGQTPPAQAPAGQPRPSAESQAQFEASLAAQIQSVRTQLGLAGEPDGFFLLPWPWPRPPKEQPELPARPANPKLTGELIRSLSKSAAEQKVE